MQPERPLGFYKKENMRIAAIKAAFSLFGELKAINPRVWDRVPRFKLNTFTSICFEILLLNFVD